MKILLAMLCLFVTGFFGAYLSVLIRRQQCNVFWLLTCTLASAGVWMYQAKDNSMSIARASILFDVVVGAAYFLGFLWMGEAARWQEITGLLLAFLGLLIAST